MKKLLCCVLSIYIVISVCTFGAAAAETELILSELSEAECIAFLKNKGVTIPDDYEDERAWGPFVKDTIRTVEQNPNVEFVYNYSVTLAFANEIKNVVNQYYGIEELEQFSGNARKVSALVDSEVYGEWTEEFRRYNCYSYALGITDDWLDPGNISGFTYSLQLSVYTVANYVKADLEALGYSNVRIEAARPTSSDLGAHEKAICVRIQGGVDYHFMKLDGVSWYHKPSISNTLRYKYMPSEDRVWTNEGIVDGVIKIPSCEYTSNIRYIIYSEPHTWGYEYCGSGQHIKTCTVCGETSGSPLACIIMGNACKSCGNQIGIPITPNKLGAVALEAA